MFDLHVRNEEREERKEAGGRRRRQTSGRHVASKAMFACEQWNLPRGVKSGAFAAFPAFGWNDGNFGGLASLHLLGSEPAFAAFAPGCGGMAMGEVTVPYSCERVVGGNVRQGVTRSEEREERNEA